MGKKGLSGIVTVILFVLLILVAVGIIWAFLGPFINQGGETLGGVSECLDLTLEAKGCVSYELITNQFFYNVTIERGADNSELASVGIILYELDGDTVVVTNNTDLPGSLETRFYPHIRQEATSGVYDSFAVVGTILTDDGQEYNCEQISEVTSCT